MEPNCRCMRCGSRYDAYHWGSCPQCKATETGRYALSCLSCSRPFFAAEREDLCPRCGSGETDCVFVPATGPI